MGFHIRENMKILFTFIKAEWKFLIVVIFMTVVTYEIIQMNSKVSSIERDISSIQSDVSSVQTDVSYIESYVSK